MTRDQLTELAARVTDTSIPIYAFTLDELVDFADAIIAEEREACARICDEGPSFCSDAIRARDNA
jgi:hypothetical protein